jgi:regulator of protease activity HflC (stomatin/prohibitin superfamily)
MFGIGYVAVPPTTFVMWFRNGRVRREGLGLSFFYLEPGATIVAVPVASTDLPFIFEEVTGDFQGVTVQGHLTFRIADPKRLASLLDYSLRGGAYATDDPARLPARIAHAAQTATRAEIQSRVLRAALVEAEAIGARVLAALRDSATVSALGVEVIAFSVLAIRPAPETGRALEAAARERLLREADDAVYARRNNAVEQERTIRENELTTEKAVQARQREIDETKMEASIHLEHRKN